MLKAGLVVKNGIVTNENYKNQNKSINTCTNRVRILIKNASSLIEYKLKNWSISYSNYELIKFDGIEDTIKITELMVESNITRVREYGYKDIKQDNDIVLLVKNKI